MKQSMKKSRYIYYIEVLLCLSRELKLTVLQVLFQFTTEPVTSLPEEK